MNFLNNFFDKLLLFFFKKKNLKNNIKLSSKSKILLLSFGGINNSLNVTPLIQSLYEQKQPLIYILTSEKNIINFHNNPYITKIYYIENSLYSNIKTVLKFSKLNLDVIINTNEFSTKNISRFLALIKSKYKIGFNDVNNPRNLSHIVEPLDKNKVHIVDRILHLLTYFDFEVVKTNLNVNYFPTKNALDNIGDYFLKHNLNHSFRVLINVSGFDELGSWRKTSYMQLLKFLKNYDIKIILTGNLDDIKVLELLADKKYLIFCSDDLMEYAALVQSCNFIFTPQSHTIQLASSKKIPVFCLFAQQGSNEMLSVPYNSDFDFAVTDKDKLENISYGKVLNSFVPYFEYVYQRYKTKD